MSSRRRMLMSASSLKSKGVIDGVIQDDLKTLIKICKAGKADQYYSVGDHVSIPIDGLGTFYFDYLGSGLDVRSDGQNKPVSSWLCRSIVATCVWNTTVTTAGGWEFSNIRNYCRESFFKRLPNYLEENIVEVDKVTGGTITSDTVWIPSYEEMQPTGLYKERFPDKASRAKDKTSFPGYWLRTSFQNSYARVILASGSYATQSVDTNSVGVVPGFCI